MTIPSRRDLLAAGLAAGAGLAWPHRARSAQAPKIKVGQIGVGHAHATKLEVYRRSSDYEVVGVVEPDASLRERAGQQPAYRDVTWLTEEQLLNTPGLSAVLVETKVRDLLNTAERCIAAGMHIHLDKPAGDSLPQFRRLLAAAEKNKRLVQMGYMYRYSPAVILLRQMLRDRWLGDVFEIHTVMSKVVGPAERKQLAEFRGGIMFELGCHVIDSVVAILGKPERIHAFPRHSAAADDGLMDNMLAVFEYPSATASVKSAALEVDGGARRHFVVCGSLGTFHIQPLDNPAVRLTLDRPRGEYKQGVQEITLPKFTRYVADAADMAQVLRGEKEFGFSYAHDLAVQESVLRASGVAT
ncbi:MAG TPA: Gfo/Idh/MocA family oxidoreductase [Pirellulaceae bacterium]|nr:Gfo/Idh/MocA family oxidoreductase [Pirellulaceae bacterium]